MDKGKLVLMVMLVIFAGVAIYTNEIERLKNKFGRLNK